MKQRMQGMIIGMLVMTLLLGTVSVFATTPQTIEVVFGGIRTTLFGQEFVVRDEQGVVIEPFVYNGRTYVPVDTVLHAMGANAQWNEDTQTLNFGAGQEHTTLTSLDSVQHSNFIGNGNSIHRITGTITDHLGNQHSNGVIVSLHRHSVPISNDPDNAHAIVEFPLNSRYHTLNGRAVLPRDIDSSGLSRRNISPEISSTVLFFGDGVLLHSVNHITASIPIDFSIDVSGVNKLTIKVIPIGIMYTALTDVTLSM